VPRSVRRQMQPPFARHDYVEFRAKAALSGRNQIGRDRAESGMELSGVELQKQTDIHIVRQGSQKRSGSAGQFTCSCSCGVADTAACAGGREEAASGVHPARRQLRLRAPQDRGLRIREPLIR
jgi:hypothetical protein